MAGDTQITVVGNLVDDPELRFTPSGAAVANFRIASTPRTFDRQSNEWKDGEALFLSCSVWRQAAENVAESLQKGMRVVVQGNLRSRQYETREGEKRIQIASSQGNPFTQGTLHADLGYKIGDTYTYAEMDPDSKQRSGKRHLRVTEVTDNHVLVNPLVYDGYPSIGCAPCTRRVAPGDDPRSGRWAGTNKTECGIHR